MEGFNPPPAFRKGETSCFAAERRGTRVSIRPPPFGRGKRRSGRAQGAEIEFQSAPRLSEGGNLSLLLWWRAVGSFNPPPAFRKGETWGRLNNV